MKELLNIYTDVANVDATPFNGFEFTVKGNTIFKTGSRIVLSMCIQVISGGSAEFFTFGGILGASVVLVPGDNYIRSESVLDNGVNFRSITTVINTSGSQSIYQDSSPASPLSADTNHSILIIDLTATPAASDVVLKFASVYLTEPN